VVGVSTASAADCFYTKQALDNKCGALLLLLSLSIWVACSYQHAIAAGHGTASPYCCTRWRKLIAPCPKHNTWRGDASTGGGGAGAYVPAFGASQFGGAGGGGGEGHATQCSALLGDVLLLYTPVPGAGCSPRHIVLALCTLVQPHAPAP
jgi:hypothetical protein